MSFYKIKINKADTLFSNLVREMAGWRCQWCGRLCRLPSGEWIWRLEASHYWTRNHWNVRYDLRNVTALCNRCHSDLGEYKRNEDGEYDLWMKERLGEQGYKLLKLDANAPSKFRYDEKMWVLYVKQLVEEWKAGKLPKLVPR